MIKEIIQGNRKWLGNSTVSRQTMASKLFTTVAKLPGTNPVSSQGRKSEPTDY